MDKKQQFISSLLDLLQDKKDNAKDEYEKEILTELINTLEKQIR